MIPPLITSLLLAASLLAQETPSAPLLEEGSSMPLLTSEYTAFLKAVASTSDPHGLYQDSMKQQVVRVLTKNGFDYLIAKNQASEPMHHLTDLDAMRYCNWKDHDSLTSALDLEESTEQGSYELNHSDQVTAADNNAPYQMLFAEGDFAIIHLAAASATTSPLMFFPETAGEKKSTEEEKAKKAEALEQAARRMSETPRSDSQAASSVASRTTLSEAQPKENVLPSATTSVLPSSRYSKTSQGPSFVSLARAGIIATFLHLSKAILPVGAAEVLIIKNPVSQNATASAFPPKQIKAAQHATPPEYAPLPNQEVGYLARGNFIPVVTSTCVFLENYISPISNFFNRCNTLEQTCSRQRPLADWLQCDQLPNSEFYKGIAALKKTSYSLLTSPEAKNPDITDFDFSKLDEVLAEWKRIVQECEKKASQAPTLLAQQAWKLEQEEAKQQQITDQAYILSGKAEKSYSAFRSVISTITASEPKSPADVTAQLAAYNKAIAACKSTKKVYQDLLDHLTSYRHSLPKHLDPSWDNIEHSFQEKVQEIQLKELEYQRNVLLYEANEAQDKAWLDLEKTKKVTEETITTLANNWDEIIQKFRKASELNRLILKELLKQQASKGDPEHSLEKRDPFEYNALWAIASKKTQIASVIQKQKMDELPDMSAVKKIPHIILPTEDLPDYIRQVKVAWEEVIAFCQEQLNQLKQIQQQEQFQKSPQFASSQQMWKECLTNTKVNKENFLNNLIIQETKYRGAKKMASDHRGKQQKPQQEANPTEQAVKRASILQKKPIASSSSSAKEMDKDAAIARGAM